MKPNFIYIPVFLFVLFSCGVMHQAVNTPVINKKIKDISGNEILLGHCSRSCLLEPPFKEWFEKNYTDYKVDTGEVVRLKPLLHDKTILVFMGTWCGDSRREVPRLIKILDHCGMQDAQLKLIMVDYQDGAYKQSPQHEERDRQIFRVPTFLVLEGNKEKGRIVELPKQSLEKDLLEIVTKKNYQPQYEAGKWIFERLEKTPVKKLYRDSAVISLQIKPRLKNSSELNSIGYVLLDRGELEKSIFIFLLNTDFYPTSISAYNGMANAFIKSGQKNKAKIALEKASQIDANNEETRRLEKLLE